MNEEFTVILAIKEKNAMFDTVSRLPDWKSKLTKKRQIYGNSVAFIRIQFFLWISSKMWCREVNAKYIWFIQNHWTTTTMPFRQSRSLFWQPWFRFLKKRHRIFFRNSGLHTHLLSPFLACIICEPYSWGHKYWI